MRKKERIDDEELEFEGNLMERMRNSGGYYDDDGEWHNIEEERFDRWDEAVALRMETAEKEHD